MPPGLRQTETKQNVSEDSDDEDDSNGRTSRVSLSGLLNAIDGVAAPEGHILIMTTNKPEVLDDALVRAGRVSVRVSFTRATKGQAEEIFKRMYLQEPSSSSPSSEATTADADKKEKDKKPEEPIISEAELADLAKRFADSLPEDEYSPADLQDYLLVHKKDPAKAVDGVPAWMEKMQEERRKKEDEKEAERERKVKKREEKARKWKEELMEAVKGTKEEAEKGVAIDNEEEKHEDEGDKAKGKEKEDEAEKKGEQVEVELKAD